MAERVILCDLYYMLHSFDFEIVVESLKGNNWIYRQYFILSDYACVSIEQALFKQ